MIGHKFRLYLPIGEVTFGTLDWDVGDVFRAHDARFEILDMLHVPEAMGSEYDGVWTVSPVQLAEQG